MSRSLLHLIPGALAAAALALASPVAHAGKFVYPYNHTDLAWYSIETEHFVIHYPQSKVSKEDGNEHFLTAEWSARKAAKVAEDMWEPMCAQFNYYLKEKIHIVLLNQSDDLEGFTIPSWDWIEISANPGSWFYRERGHMEWFSDVLVHAFAHVVSLKANGWMAEGTQGVLMGGLYRDGIRDMDSGAELIVGDADSVFWTEGGAEYWSDNSGYNIWTAKRDTVLRTTVLEGRLLTYDEWHDRAGKSTWWRDGERYYQQGYSFGQYLRQRFGDRTYAQFAVENGKRGWHLKWESVIKEVTGVDAETLYNDWVVYATEKYTAQAEAKAREKTGRYQFYAKISPEGDQLAVNTGFGLNVSAVDESMFPAFSQHSPADPGKAEDQALLSVDIPVGFGDGYDFVPGTNKIVVTGSEDMMPGLAAQLTKVRLERDGYDWKQLWVFDLTPMGVEAQDGTMVKTRIFKDLAGKTKLVPKDTYKAIPNTQRGSDPAVSPDGKRVAYFEYTDGTQNLVTINLDGSDKKYLTNYTDGTWMQQVDWSPDGKQLVFAMLRNYQKNLYILNADGTGLTPISMDGWEDQDALWHTDGKIYFSSDPGGVFNIYSFDPATREYRQITNVIGAAECPVITPEGNLLYVHYTSFGWKVYGLSRGEFLNAPVTAVFNPDYDKAAAAEDMAYQEDLSAYKPEPYHFSRANLMAPTATPMFRVENDSQTNFGLQAGVQIFMQDYVEKNGLFLYTLLGEDTLYLAQYFTNVLPFTINVSAYHYETKYNAGYLLDEDDDPATTDDQTVWEIRNAQYANVASVAADYTWNPVFYTAAYSRFLGYGFKGTNDAGFQPYMREVEAGFNATFSTAGAAGYRPNTFTGRTIDLAYNHAWTDIVYAAYGGVATDDGEALDNYQYNKVELRWTENIRMPAFGGIQPFKAAHDHNHVIQVDAQVGYIDRNVDGNDEFNAGGQHPYFWGSGTLRPNTQFAGYPGFSLSGETMAILNLAYRFPINQYMAKQVGPLFIHGIFAQVGGTAGNLWSYDLAPGADVTYDLFGQAVAESSGDVRREIPFVDVAHKNGNRVLTDASAELRVQSTIFHGMPWDSFLRVAWGFNEIGGYGDVNGDGIFDTSENSLSTELSTETEKPGPRVYLGFGTGW